MGGRKPQPYNENLLTETIRLIKKYGVRPKKRLSQSFVVDRLLVRTIVENVQPKPSDVIVEIGAGLGTLTFELAKHGSKVKAVEIDPALVRVLKDRFSAFQNVEVVQGDFTKIDLKGNVYTGNIPYHVSTPVIFRILEQNYEKAVITVQKEVAERIVSKPGSREYGRLTVSVNTRAEPRVLGFFPSSSFYPRPKVSHAVLYIKPSVRNLDTSILEDLLRAMFSQRNRLARTVLRNSLERLYGEKGKRAYNSVFHIVPEGSRVFELNVQDFLNLAKAVSNNIGA
ncbi:MAG: 16S rRNA (adenine(1518)-N(6)/adenine(1519)-N(6))-dimethyltransferase RsmA [Thermoproteota archaeon]|nr:ribosomal RNA small subunit methyltransferase A [Candidatus Brockarchaeota archaeon]